MEESGEKEKTGQGSGAIEPVQLTGKSRLRFLCHKGLSCWNACCHNMSIMLAPYDILRLRRRLGMASGEFLETYTNLTIHQESGLPVVILRPTDGDDPVCPFNTDEGCSVYEDRPSICRYYPIGLANLRTQMDEKKEAEEERFYFLIREDYCLGHGEEKEWSIDEFRENQGASRDDQINRDWQTAFLSRSLPGEERNEPRRQSLFHMACYDLDAFRRFVFESSFLRTFEVDEETLAEIRGDDEELLRFALRYMKFFMMIEPTMKPREGVIESWRKKHQDTMSQFGKPGKKAPPGDVS